MNVATGDSRPASLLERAFHGAPEILSPATESALADVLRDAHTDGRRLLSGGAGAHAALRDHEEGVSAVVSAEAFDSIVEYQPDDFTVGVGAGVPLAELRETLARNGQEIPTDWPRLTPGTVGGLVARAPAGVRQGRYGPLHASVLGLEATTGDGRRIRSGGMVVKNVAGYQLHKFLVGALGEGAVLRRINFRLRPLPASRRAGISGFETPEDAWQWARALRGAGLDPASLVVMAGEATSGLAGAGIRVENGQAAAAWIFEGNRATVAWQERQAAALAAEHGVEVDVYDTDVADALIDRVASYAETLGTVPGDVGLVRIALLPSAAAGTAVTLREAFRAHPDFYPGYVGDVLTGFLFLRWTGPADRIHAPVKTLRQVVRTKEGVMRLHYLPATVRGRYKHRLTADVNASWVDRVLHSLDPSLVLSARRARGETADTGGAS